MRVLPSFLRADALAEDLDAELQSSKSQFLIPPRPSRGQKAIETTKATKVDLVKEREAIEARMAQDSRDLRHINAIIDGLDAMEETIKRAIGLPNAEEAAIDAPEVEEASPPKDRKVPRQTPARLPKAVPA